MRRATGFVVLLLAVQAGAQTSLERRFSLYCELGYFSPSKTTLRSNYVRGFYLGPLGVPLAGGLGLARQLSGRTSVYLDLHPYIHTLRSDRETWLMNIPVVVGFRQSFRDVSESAGLRVFAGAGVGVCVSRLAAHYYVTGENSPEIIGEARDVRGYVGMALRFSIDLEISAGARFFYGVTLNYDLAEGGSADEGGLGNVGGLFAGLRVGVRF